MRWEGTILAEVAQYVLDWAERALVMADFSRGDYSYSLECILVLLGRRVRGFIIRRSIFSRYPMKHCQI